MYGMDNVMHRVELARRGVSIGTNHTRHTLMDVLITQLMQDGQGARASSSAMSVDKAPFYELIGCDHASGEKAVIHAYVVGEV